MRVLAGADGVQIRACDLVDNAGLGVSSRSDSLVDAAHNWWGDPAGPHGTEGDGVQGNVAIEPWLTTPVYNSDGDG